MEHEWLHVCLVAFCWGLFVVSNGCVFPCNDPIQTINKEIFYITDIYCCCCCCFNSSFKITVVNIEPWIVVFKNDYW